MKAKTCVDTKEVTVKLLRQDDVSEEASSDKAMLILIDGYFDSAYDEAYASVRGNKYHYGLPGNK